MSPENPLVTAGLVSQFSDDRKSFSPAAAIASVGSLTPALLAEASDLHASLPARLLTAARSPIEAPILLYGLLLDTDDEHTQRRQLAFIAGRAGGDALNLLQSLDVSLRELGPEQSSLSSSSPSRP